MQYDIRLSLEQSYPAASVHVRNLARLLPSDGPQQRVQRRLLSIQPMPDERRDGRDFFGNATTLVAWHRPVQAISFTLSAQAERLSEAVLDMSPPLDRLAEEISATGLGPDGPLHFRGPSPRIARCDDIAAFARDCCPVGATAFDVVETLGRALHQAMTFDAGATDVGTRPADAFAARRGVCQDFAQIMICGLRALGVPAGYVSGFIRTTPPPGQPRLAGVDAMHGWVRAWCGLTQGWVEYDPTNAGWAGEDYITVAVGRDYGDAAPVKGAVRTSGAQKATHSVDMVAL